jgi:hypothetical protein
MVDKLLRTGDLVTVSPGIPKGSLYTELRDTLRKVYYATPQHVVKSGDLLLVLKLEGDDALIVTPEGRTGWIRVDMLDLVSA